MWILLDAAVAVLLIWSIVRGYKKGLVKTAFKCGIVIASLIIAYSFSPVISGYVSTTKGYERLTTSVSENIMSHVSENMQKETSDKVISEDDSFSAALKGLGIETSDINKTIDERVAKGVQSIEDAVNELIVRPVSKTLCDALCFIALFVACILVLHLVMYILDAVFRLPLLRSVNKAGGAVAGIVAGLLKIFVFCTIVEMLLPYIQNPSIGLYCGMESKTLIYKILMQYNPLSFLY